MAISRRTFIGAGAAAAASLTLDRTARADALRATITDAAESKAATRPVVIASRNGIRGVARAYDMITRQNADTLDAIIAGVNIQELDPEDQSVGLGGLPNEDGVVQLDASCMHGPTKRAGAVAALEDIATPSLVAKAVMDYTDHIMLVGAGRQEVRAEMGFKEQNLLTEKSRQDWLRWKACLNPDDNWLDDRAAARYDARRRADVDDALQVKFTTGTINMNAVNAAGDMSSVTTTSGLAWKMPGRIGRLADHRGRPVLRQSRSARRDRPAAVRPNIKVCGAFLIVEFMRQGLSPEQACLRTIERVIATTERRLLDPRGRPLFDLAVLCAREGRTLRRGDGVRGRPVCGRRLTGRSSGSRCLRVRRGPSARRMPRVSCRRA